jgi:hypothetical protein
MFKSSADGNMKELSETFRMTTCTVATQWLRSYPKLHLNDTHHQMLHTAPLLNHEVRVHEEVQENEDQASSHKKAQL